MNGRQLGLMVALLLVLLAGSVVFMLRRAPDKLQLIADPAGAGSVTAVSIIRPGAREIRLARVRGGWRITAPSNLPADTRRVGTMLNALKYANAAPELSRNPADFGLFGVDPSSGIKFRADTPSGPLTEFVAGRQTGNAWYILHNGAVSEAAGFPFAYLAGSAADWTDNTVIAVSSLAVIGLEVKSDFGSVSLGKTERGWQYSQSGRSAAVPPEAREEVLKPALELLARFRAEKVFCAGPDCRPPAKKPDCSISVISPGRYDPAALKIYYQDSRTVLVTNSELPELVFAADSVLARKLCSLPEKISR
ncbi:MAG: DUF4340 domain-containing protein [Elusimicrobiaceae bacterium]|nr:DUF4340 domain-containing protein [Elusimicrobiaceae bacterium]